MSTDLNKVFDLLLQRAKAFTLRPEDMVKTLFIFSDMEFDEACPGSKATNFEHAKAQFAAAGFQLPAVVFWNLRGDSRTHGRGASVPVRMDERGVALVSGFSGQLLKLFLGGPDEIRSFTPESVLAQALEPYKDWHLPADIDKKRKHEAHPTELEGPAADTVMDADAPGQDAGKGAAEKRVKVHGGPAGQPEAQR